MSYDHPRDWVGAAHPVTPWIQFLTLRMHTALAPLPPSPPVISHLSLQQQFITDGDLPHYHSHVFHHLLGNSIPWNGKLSAINVLEPTAPPLLAGHLLPQLCLNAQSYGWALPMKARAKVLSISAYSISSTNRMSIPFNNRQNIFSTFSLADGIPI